MCQLALGSLCVSSRGILGCTSFSAKSARIGCKAPNVTNHRKVLEGSRYKRDKEETRGETELYKSNVLTTNKARKELIKKHKNDREVRWEDIRKKACVKKGHRSTLLKAFRRGKILVAARRPRANRHRTPEHKAERYELTDMFVNKGPGIT